VDGMHEIESRKSSPGRKNQWFDFMCNHTNFEQIADPRFHADPSIPIVREFVNSVLDACAEFGPDWLSVPQLPVVDDAARNKVNRQMAKATSEWKEHSGFKGKLILPLVFTHQAQLNSKVARNPKVQHALRCHGDAGADGIWIVDKNVDDDCGSNTLHDTRFPGIIGLHEEINEAIEPGLALGGPYWALNLVLWARGLVNHPVIGVGSGYQYFMSGGHAHYPTARAAIPSLKRLVEVDHLDGWLQDAMRALPDEHSAQEEFGEILGQLDDLNDPAVARAQVVGFYKAWYDSIDQAEESERSGILYEQFSSAYKLGRKLPDIPKERPRRPEAVAQMLMLSCL
jgi:hypothetical protein